MDVQIILGFVGVGVAGFVVGLLVGRSGRRDGQMMVRPNISSPSDPFGASRPVSLEAMTPSASFAASAAPGEVIDEQMRQLLHQNKLIEAIKLYRERTGCGLKEAKDAVEAERDRMRAGVPVVATRYQGMVHNFPRKLAIFDAAHAAVAQIAAILRRW